jgi:hypothetical protein
MFQLIKALTRLPFIKAICYINIICLFLIILILKLEPKSTPFSLVTVVNSLTSSSIKSPFRDELINERLTSYSRIYDNSLRECNTSEPLDDQRKNDFSAVSKLLISLRQQIVPYPNEYFHGRGIVLTVGPSQLQLTRVNLRMIEFSGTRLPVQVNIIVSIYT